MTFIIILAVMAYALVAGLTYSQVLSINTRRHRCSERYSTCDHEFPAFFAAIGWPIGIPMNAGVILGDTDNRRKLKAQREREAADHKIEIADRELRAAQADEQRYKILERTHLSPDPLEELESEGRWHKWKKINLS